MLDPEFHGGMWKAVEKNPDPEILYKQRLRIAGQEVVGKCTMIYFDHAHTGESEDLLYVELDDGRRVRGPASKFECTST